MRDFNASERCDRCGAQARHEAYKPGHTKLLFCNHHHREHQEALLSNYWLIQSDIEVVVDKHTNRIETNEVQ